MDSTATRQAVIATCRQLQSWPCQHCTDDAHSALCQHGCCARTKPCSVPWRWAEPSTEQALALLPGPTVPSLLIISLVAINLIMKPMHPFENITSNKEFFFPFFTLILLSCAGFQSTSDEKERIYLFWCKHLAVNKGPKAWHSCGADGSCCPPSMPLQIRSQDVFYHNLQVAREQPAAKIRKDAVKRLTGCKGELSAIETQAEKGKKRFCKKKINLICQHDYNICDKSFITSFLEVICKQIPTMHRKERPDFLPLQMMPTTHCYLGALLTFPVSFSVCKAEITPHVSADRIH